MKDLKKMILASKEYDEESAKEWLNTLINERKEREENERRNEEIQMEERRRKEEQEVAERRHQEEIELRKQEYEERMRKEKYEERKLKDEMEFELQKIRLGAESRSLNSNFVTNQNVNSMQIKHKLEIHHLMQKFNSDENDISLCLIMFERLAKQAEILVNTWVTHLLGLLPYDVAHLIAREPDEIANDYGGVKKILLKRYKLRPEKFRQKFFMHKKNLGSTWKNFAYELRNFFNEWVSGVKADSFEKLRDLIITDQIKRKVTQEVKDHFIDGWSKLNSPDDLVKKLYDYETLRSTFRSKQPRKEWHYDKQNSLKDNSAFTTDEKKKLYGITHNERGEPKCFNCFNFGHIARNCSLPKSVLICREVDIIIGRTWLDLPHIAYTKKGKRVHIGYREDELFRNFPIDEKVNPVYLKRLETVQSESESLQIKDTSQQRMMGNLEDDLKMVKNELRLLQGDIKNFKEERQSRLLQIQKKNKNVDNLKSINNSLVKTNSYYDKNKSGKVSLRKGDIVAVRRKPNTTGESTKSQPRYRGPMVVTEVRPSDTYRISQLEPRKGRPYATIVHVSQLKA
ncbi:hypothetical protein AVEN_117795-1 [Araneus ventricosus]|uniref:CCHC-type domain-containing protein n=1 Tax=Araneus ventricosus TaxID=182803 RepID=A0A4Y2B745_ARAVE|nr:hypothetical protein AVEN_117795-1 [Araneus ventricosus]